ncbi:TPA: fimbrial protein [Burkholderia cenocepacia]|uniref:fimbrial protein n=1 Tax=Burkholderia sp. BCC0801 TaxID=2676291 RepID=UPI00158890B4|nr:fimbrial protein [Burkholderia sp. BCC0801]HEF5870682.1 fimbrial protein [Burkholderia cenocepacia]
MSAGMRSGAAARMPGWLRWCVLALFVALAQPAWALKCVANGSGMSLTESIGNVASYPTDAPDGYVIWVSPPRTTTGYCYKDVPRLQNFPEQVYFYANPAMQNPAAWGLEIGIRYGGEDHYGRGSLQGDRIDTGSSVGVCHMSDREVAQGRCPKVPISITYQIVVRKRGTWVTPPSDVYAVFQFDGERGLNSSGSFRYFLSGLQKLKPTPCTVDVLVTPETGIVNFGQVQTSGNGFLPAVPRKRFSLSLTKKCSIPVRVDGYFEATKGTVQNGLLVPESNSNFGIGLEDSQGKPMEFNKQFTLTQFPANVANQSVMLDAVLKSFGPPKIGPFNASATIRIFLY